MHDQIAGSTPSLDGCRIFRFDTVTNTLLEIFNSTMTGLFGFPNRIASPGTASPQLSGGNIEAWFGGVLEATGLQGQVD